MKNLFIIRHAKSSWDNTDMSDFERPLNKRGKRDAPFMGKLLSKKKIKVDAIISSPALRALSTAEIFAEQMEFPVKDIIKEEGIYESGIKELEDIVRKLSNEYSTVMLFGHNPTLTSFSNHIGNKCLDNLPTCAIVGIEFDINNWKEVERGKGKTFLFEYPKKYFHK